ncbi:MULTISPECIES: STAS domain-containing protein [unclassified Selenomonas]|uniref:STAS domain-containing protein n=1 Tax=unclassified Selenomonas TaxID=2637378 RepID=UPI0004957595|nr:anti-sigma B factor antagonist [Selenomonas ruminantium]
MNITEKKQNNWLVLALTDRLDTQTAPELEQVAMGKLGDGVQMALELSELQYISSAGLRVLLMIMKKAKAAGGKAALVGVGGMVGEILEESGIDAFFEQYEDLEALP